MLNDQQFKFHLARYAKVSEKDAEVFMDAVTQVLLEKIQQGEDVTIQGLGTFSVIENQQGRRLAFQVDDKMRSLVNAPFACFEPMVLASKPAPVSKTKEEQADVAPIVEPSAELLVEPIVESAVDSAVQPEEPVEEQPIELTVEPIVEQSDKLEAERLDEPIAEQSVDPVDIQQIETVEDPEDNRTEEKKAVPVSKADTSREESSAVFKPWMWCAIAGVVLIVLAALYFAHSSAPEPEPVATIALQPASESPKNIAVVEDIPPIRVHLVPKDKVKTTNEDTSGQVKTSVSYKPTSDTPNTQSKPQKPTSEMILHADGQPKMLILGDGERLTLAALRQYGDKAFWAYIYDVNAFQLGDPDNVPTGRPLYLPDPTYYRIDADDPSSIKRAQNRAMQIIKNKK